MKPLVGGVVSGNRARLELDWNPDSS